MTELRGTFRWYRLADGGCRAHLCGTDHGACIVTWANAALGGRRFGAQCPVGLAGRTVVRPLVLWLTQCQCPLHHPRNQRADTVCMASVLLDDIANCLSGIHRWLVASGIGLVFIYFHLCRFYMDQCRLLVEKRVSRGGGVTAGDGSVSVWLFAQCNWNLSGIQPKLWHLLPLKAIPILLITIDTLRRDHISAYHPNPSEALFRHQRSTHWPRRIFDAVTPILKPFLRMQPLCWPPSGWHVFGQMAIASGTRYTTLAQFFGSEGYSTAAFVSSYAPDSKGGLTVGFSSTMISSCPILTAPVSFN